MGIDIGMSEFSGWVLYAEIFMGAVHKDIIAEAVGSGVPKALLAAALL